MPARHPPSCRNALLGLNLVDRACAMPTSLLLPICRWSIQPFAPLGSCAFLVSLLERASLRGSHAVLHSSIPPFSRATLRHVPHRFLPQATDGLLFSFCVILIFSELSSILVLQIIPSYPSNLKLLVAVVANSHTSSQLTVDSCFSKLDLTVSTSFFRMRHVIGIVK